MQVHEDKPLLDRLRAGDEVAFEELVRANGSRMLAVARRILRSEEDARDAVQEAFLHAFQHLADFHGESKLATWLYRIAINSSLMRLRSRTRKREDPIDPLLPRFYPDGHRIDPGPPWPANPDEDIDRRRTFQAVRACIDRLPDGYRTVLLLRDVEGLSTEEAATLLGLKPDAVKMRLHRARQALRSLLDPQLGQAN